MKQNKEVIKGTCKTCKDEFETGFLPDGRPAISMEEYGYDSLPCAIIDLLKRIKKLEKKIK